MTHRNAPLPVEGVGWPSRVTSEDVGLRVVDTSNHSDEPLDRTRSLATSYCGSWHRQRDGSYKRGRRRTRLDVESGPKCCRAQYKMISTYCGDSGTQRAHDVYRLDGRRLLRRLIVIGAGVVAGMASGIQIACGVAVALPDQPAPDTTGQTLGGAETTLSAAGLHPVVQTTLGDRKPLSNCTVARQQLKYVPPPQAAIASGFTRVLLTLNCYAGVATVTSPGNSPESPAGQLAAAAAASSAAATPPPSAPAG